MPGCGHHPTEVAMFIADAKANGPEWVAQFHRSSLRDEEKRYRRGQKESLRFSEVRLDELHYQVKAVFHQLQCELKRALRTKDAEFFRELAEAMGWEAKVWKHPSDPLRFAVLQICGPGNRVEKDGRKVYVTAGKRPYTRAEVVEFVDDFLKNEKDNYRQIGRALKEYGIQLVSGKRGGNRYRTEVLGQ